MTLNGLQDLKKKKTIWEKFRERGKKKKKHPKLIRCMGGLLQKEIKGSRIIQFGKEREGIWYRYYEITNHVEMAKLAASIHPSSKLNENIEISIYATLSEYN